MPRWNPKKARTSTPTTNVPITVVAPAAVEPIQRDLAPHAPVDMLTTLRARVLSYRIRSKPVPEELRVHDHLRYCGKLAVAQIRSRMQAEGAAMDRAEEYSLKHLTGR